MGELTPEWNAHMTWGEVRIGKGPPWVGVGRGMARRDRGAEDKWMLQPWSSHQGGSLEAERKSAIDQPCSPEDRTLRCGPDGGV